MIGAEGMESGCTRHPRHAGGMRQAAYGWSPLEIPPDSAHAVPERVAV